MKPSQSSSLGTLDENTVDLIEGLGGDQTYLFGDEEDRKSQRRLLVICESGNIREGTLIVWNDCVDEEQGAS